MKKAFLMFVSLAMCFLLLTIPALAGGGFDFYNYPASRDGAGWSWNEADNTLTLNGLDYESTRFVPGANDHTIRLPADSTVILKGTNTFISRFGGISAEGNLTIDGSGSLAINSVFSTNGDITLNGGTLTINAKPNSVFVVRLLGRNITINDGVLTTNSVTKSEGIGSNGIFAFNSIAINGGSVTINSGNVGIVAMGLAINGGSVVISDAGDAGIQTIGDIVLNGGYLAIKNAFRAGISTFSNLIINGGDGIIEASGQYILAAAVAAVRDINVADGVIVKGWDESANDYILHPKLIRVVLPQPFELDVSPRNTFADAAQNVPLRNIYFNSADVAP